MEPLLLLFSTTLGELTLMATVAKRLNMLCPADHCLSQGFSFIMRPKLVIPIMKVMHLLIECQVVRGW